MPPQSEGQEPIVKSKRPSGMTNSITKIFNNVANCFYVFYDYFVQSSFFFMYIYN